MPTLSDRLNICLVTSAYPPTPDGFATYSRDLAVSLVNLGQLVTVICAGHSEQQPDDDSECYDSGVRVIRLSQKLNITQRLLRRATGLIQLAESHKIHRALRKYHSQVAFDVIEFSNWHAPATIHSVFKIAPQIVRVSTTLRQVITAQFGARGPTEARRKEKKASKRLITLEAFCLCRSDLIVAPNRSHWREVADDDKLQLAQDKLVAIVPLGIDVSRVGPKRSRESHGECCRLLFVGRLTYRKGIDVFLKALPQIIANANHEIHVTIIGGDGTEPDGTSSWQKASTALDVAVRQCIEYLGVVSDQEREDHYECADVFVGPSRYESFGLMYVEAMAHGLPVVGGRVGGIPEVIEDLVTGLLVEPGDVEALADAVIRLVNDEGLRQQLGEAAQASVTRRFAREDMALSMLNAYRSLLSGSKVVRD